MPHDKEFHRGMMRVCISKDNVNRAGVELLRWFFVGDRNNGTAAHRDRRSKTWTSPKLARAAMVPLGQVTEAFQAGRREGVVELTEEGWRWVG